VTSYIAKAKSWPINWAKVTAYTTREKVQRELAKKMQHASNKLEFSKLIGGSKLSGRFVSTNKSKGDLVTGVIYLKHGRLSNV